MITLKQTLLTLAAMTASVYASPLAADSTATSIAGAPAAAVTQVSKPLEGAELAAYLANEPTIPAGSIDISNTTLSLELAQFSRSHSAANLLTKRSGACNQGQCPDFFSAFDLYCCQWPGADVLFLLGPLERLWTVWRDGE